MNPLLSAVEEDLGYQLTKKRREPGKHRRPQSRLGHRISRNGMTTSETSQSSGSRGVTWLSRFGALTAGIYSMKLIIGLLRLMKPRSPTSQNPWLIWLIEAVWGKNTDD